jgi:hypothetical protein
MKTLDKLTNTDRAVLLHQLFPQEISALLDYAEGICITIRENEAQNRTTWNNGLMSFDYWLSLLAQVEDRIKQYRIGLAKRQKLFADQLFDGLLAMVMAQVLCLYTTTRQHPDPKFTQAVNLLFT